MYRRIVILVLVFILVSVAAQAQDSGLTCPALVEQALNEVGTNCVNMGRNVACYGYKRIAATFSDPQPVGFFSIPADRAALATLQSIQTAPLNLAGGNWGVALLNVQANVPGTLPGQAVTFVLMGDVKLENNVSAAEAAPAVDSITVTVQSAATVYTGPALTANSVGTIAAGGTLPVDGVSTDGEWVRVVFENAVAWVSRAALNPADSLSTLPVVSADSRSPMQAFYFTTGLGAAACNEAPSALAIQSPENITVDLTVNGADIQIGSFVTFQSTASDGIVMTVHKGSVKTLSDSQVTEAGKSREAVLDTGGTIISWGASRPATQDELQVGQIAQKFADIVTVPATQASTTTTTTTTATTTPTCAAAAGGGTVYHVVQRGENLFRIALHYSTSVAEIASANGIANVNVVYVGQRLLIPRPCSGFVNLVQPPPAAATPAATQQVTQLPQGVDCSVFVPTSPLSGMPYNNVPFFWDPASGAASYRVNIYNANGQLNTSYLTTGPETTINIDTRSLNPGQRYYWDVEALAGGTRACVTARVSVVLDYPPVLTASWGCGPGSYQFTVTWSNAIGSGPMTITYSTRSGIQTLTPSGASGSVTVQAQDDVFSGSVRDPSGRVINLTPGSLACYR